MTTYGTHITALYRLGARMFGVLSVPPVGCVPSSRLFNATGGCMGAMNTFSNAFHSAVGTLFVNLESQLPGIKYSIGNVYEMTMDAINNPEQFGFKDVSTACCGTWRFILLLPITGEAPYEAKSLQKGRPHTTRSRRSCAADNDGHECLSRNLSLTRKVAGQH